jgi:hypothetical protein
VLISRLEGWQTRLKHLPSPLTFSKVAV